MMEDEIVSLYTWPLV